MLRSSEIDLQTERNPLTLSSTDSAESTLRSANAANYCSTDEAVEALSARLRDNALSITTAESCTGGLIAAALTSLAGSSAYFCAGIVTYSNDSKRLQLDVPATILIEHGAVSEAVVLSMAQGARRRSCADVSIAVSGVAGPDGGTDEKPVGTVWIAWSMLVQQRYQLDAERFVFAGERTEVRKAAVLEALRGTIARLDLAKTKT